MRIYKQLQHLINQTINEYQSQHPSEYPDPAGKIRLVAEIMTGQHEEPIKKVNELMKKARPIIDQDHDGLVDDYRDLDGDGVSDKNNNLNNNSIPYANPATNGLLILMLL
ncbi:MAG: hypothetical protein ACTSSP_10310 [Candidatus Asgardarchaeia archaeon]